MAKSFEELCNLYKKNYSLTLSNKKEQELINKYNLKLNNIINIKLKSNYFKSLNVKDLHNVKFQKLMLEEQDLVIIDRLFQDLYVNLLKEFYQDFLSLKCALSTESIINLVEILIKNEGIVSLDKAYKYVDIIAKSILSNKNKQAKINRKDYSKVLEQRIINLKNNNLINEYTYAILGRRLEFAINNNDYELFYLSAKSVVPKIIETLKLLIKTIIDKEDVNKPIDLNELLIYLNALLYEENINQAYDLVFNKLGNESKLNLEILLNILKKEMLVSSQNKGLK